MLHFHTKPTPILPDVLGPIPTSQPAGSASALGGPSDAAVDAALCRVSLPDGLLSRLDAMLGKLSDDAGQAAD